MEAGIKANQEHRLVLVGCGSRKDANATIANPVAAKDLYTSSYFQSKRILAELYPWRILTSYQESGIRTYDLLCPEEFIYWYEKSNKQYDEYWAAIITQKIKGFFPKGDIIIFAGEPVWKFLKPQLEDAGYTVFCPLENKRIGEQGKWLNEQVSDLVNGSPRNLDFRNRRQVFGKSWVSLAHPAT